MPIYKITGPDGQVYRIQGEGSEQEALEQLQQSLEAGGPTPTPEAQPPAAPAGAGGARVPDPASGTGPDLPGPPGGAGAVGPVPSSTMIPGVEATVGEMFGLPDFSGARGRVTGAQGELPSDFEAEMQRMNQFRSGGMPDLGLGRKDPHNKKAATKAESYLAGAGSGLISVARGLEQRRNEIMQKYLGARAEDDDIASAEYGRQLEQAEADQREIDAELLSSPTGRLGQLTAQTAAYAAPGSSFVKGANWATKAAGLGTAAKLPAMIAAGGAEGFTTGYALPTAPGEDPMANAKFGAALGASAPAVTAGLAKLGRGARWAGYKAAPRLAGDVYDALAAPIRSRAARKDAEKAAARAARDEADLATARGEARDRAGNIYSELSVPHASMGKALREHLYWWGDETPGVIKKKIRNALGDDAADAAFKALPKPKKPPKTKGPAVDMTPGADKPRFVEENGQRVFKPGKEDKLKHIDPEVRKEALRMFDEEVNTDQMPWGVPLPETEARPVAGFMGRVRPENVHKLPEAANLDNVRDGVDTVGGKAAKRQAQEGKEVEQMTLRSKGQDKRYFPKKAPKDIAAPKPANITGAVRGGRNDPFKSKGSELTSSLSKQEVSDLVEEQIAAARKRYGEGYDKPLGHSAGAKHLEGASQHDFDREFFRREFSHGDPTGAPDSLRGASHKDFRAEYARRQHMAKTGEKTSLPPKQEFLPPPLKKTLDEPHPGPTAVGGPRNTNKNPVKEARRQKTKPFRDDARGHIDPLEKARQSRESAVGRVSVADEIDLHESQPRPTRYEKIGPRLSKSEKRYRKNEAMQKLNPQDASELDVGPDASWEDILMAEKKKARYWAGRPMHKFPQGGGGKREVDILERMAGTRKHANLSDEYHDAVVEWDNKVMEWNAGGKVGPKPELPVKYRYEKMHHDQYQSLRKRMGTDPDLPSPNTVEKSLARRRADLLRERTGEYTSARLTSKHQRVQLPKDKKGRYYRGQPRPQLGPKEGPPIKGKDIDEILRLVEKGGGGEGLRGTGMQRLRNILTHHSELNMTPDQKARMAKALRVTPVKRGAEARYGKRGVARSAARATTDQYRPRSKKEDDED